MAAQDYDVAIVGGGPAGLTAGIYCSRYGLRTVIIEKMMGGAQVINTERIENYPGLPNGIPGAEFGPMLQDHAMKAGASVKLAEASRVGLSGDHRTVSTDDGDILAKAVIIAAGSSLRKLGIPGEDGYTGNGVSHCATCDGPLFSGTVVGVVGGGDTAADEALTLTKYVERVILFHRRDRLRAQQVLQDRVRTNTKIETVWNTEVRQIVGTNTVTSVQVRNVVTRLDNEVDLAGLFIYIGLEPNSAMVREVVRVDRAGHIEVDAWMQTSRQGIFAAGDIRQGSAAQLITSAGDGATAAIAAHRYIAGVQWARR
ncbi:Thioredoxin reductase [Geodia barretti]|uniref:Thioredoxin reductase n=1 Tax=Geodia barretti TaxID=519541 RepID=A0AA35S651_GEOBA|nr:Thioredoxin reductase [Geodia barretti]